MFTLLMKKISTFIQNLVVKKESFDERNEPLYMSRTLQSESTLNNCLNDKEFRTRTPCSKQVRYLKFKCQQ